MSVAETNKVDGMGKDKKTGELLLLITDHLDWSQEGEHLLLLQDKLNSYLGFIQSGQYAATYPNDRFTGFVIEIHFQHKVCENCWKFLRTVAAQTEPFHIKIRPVET